MSFSVRKESKVGNQILQKFLISFWYEYDGLDELIKSHVHKAEETTLSLRLMVHQHLILLAIKKGPIILWRHYRD